MTATPTETMIKHNPVSLLTSHVGLNNRKTLELLREKLWLQACVTAANMMRVCGPFGWRADLITFKHGIIVLQEQTMFTLHMILDESLVNSVCITMDSHAINLNADPKQLANDLLHQLQKLVYNLPDSKRWFA